MMIKTVIHSDLPIPPGEYLEEVIEELGITKDELAQRMNRPASKLSPIFKGKKAITPDTALQLEKVIGVPAHIWTGLEAEYRLTLARQQAEKEQSCLKEETSLLKLFPYSALATIRAIPKFTKSTDKVLALQKFFGVTSLCNVRTVRLYEVAFRCGYTKKERSPEAVAAWLRLGELIAQRIDCEPFDRSRLKAVLTEIGSMTTKPPKEFRPRLTNLLADAGVALVICPHLPRTYAHGATFPLNREKTVLMLTIRGKWADVFWFSLFHELGHILLHNRHSVFVEYDNGDSLMNDQEMEANTFAADTLIPPQEWSAFIEKQEFYPQTIRTFARQIGVDIGIVVGRLQHEEFLQPSWRNDLRTRYEWAE